jgi:cellulose synthase/poly-beta-1,6-N-acetylglucosamine synthase-like glycosyltransferase
MIPALYALSVGVLVVYGLNLLWLAFEALRPACDDVATDRGAQSSMNPRPMVTVQLPLFNERYVAERLIDACAHLDYPRDRFEIQVLDDSTDDTSAIVAERSVYWSERGVQIQHVRRPDRAGFKAGALQHGLDLASGSLIAIFDADFVPPANFLKVTVPHFSGSQVGMVQSRWAYLNRDSSVLTRLQALSLDAHFAVEQVARSRSGCFINFNGTAGIWRKSCIEDSGGWHADTLTEDLDLSYRAQLKGWRFKFLGTLESPSELPVAINDLRAQQFRWTKGAIQTARKTVRSLIRNAPNARIRAEGLIHLTSHLVFPFVLLAGILHAPLSYMKTTVGSPGELYFWVTGVGLLAFVGFFSSQVVAQRALHPDWLKRLALFPLFLAGSVGFSVNNTLAVADALTGRQSPFRRTPKLGLSEKSPTRTWSRSSYASRRLPPIVLAEIVLALYSAGGLVLVLSLGDWSAIPFQIFVTAGFGLVSIYSLLQVAGAR